MYNRRNLVFVLTILESIEKLYIYTADIHSANDLYEKDDQLNYNACLNLLAVVGEETKKIDALIKADFPNLRWRDVQSLRNRIVHDYRGLDVEVAYETITQHLEPLKQVSIEVFHHIDISVERIATILNSPYYRHIHYLKNDHE